MLRKCLIALAVGVLSSQAHASQYYNDPTVVNLLERWNPNGTYDVATAGDNGGDLYRAEVSHTDGYGWFGRYGSANGSTGDAYAQYTMTSAQTLGKITWNLRPNETPKEMQIYDQNGLIVDLTNGGDYLPSGMQTYILPAPRTSTYLKFVFPDVSTADHYFHATQFGGYLASGQALRIDGTYNVFYNENPPPVSANGGDYSALTDHIGDRVNPGNANSLTWHFAQDYLFTGAYLTHEVDSYFLYGTTVEVSSDGTNWQTAYGPTDFLGSGYLVFNQQLWGSYARLSWADSGSGGGRELNEFQLFAFVPEPASLTLLALPFLLLPRRKSSQV